MNKGLSKVAAVVGVGHTDWRGDYKRVRAGEKPYDSNGYGAMAFKQALADAGLQASDIDGLIVGPTTPYERMDASHRELQESLGQGCVPFLFGTGETRHDQLPEIRDNCANDHQAGRFQKFIHNDCYPGHHNLPLSPFVIGIFAERQRGKS